MKIETIKLPKPTLSAGLSKQIAVVCCIGVVLIFLLKNRYDYQMYELYWLHFLNGGNTFDLGTAYGPFHNVMAYFFDIHPKLPRFIFSFLAIVCSIFLIVKVERSSLDQKSKRTLFFLLLYNPIIWIMFVVNGCNDGLVGFLFLFGVIMYDRKYFEISALLLTIAISYKFIPLFILPILCLNNRKINWRFTLSSIFFIGLAMAWSYYLWGQSFLRPFMLNSDRDSKMLSIFRYLRGDYSFLKFFGIENLDFMSTTLVVVMVVGIFLLQYIRKWHWNIGVMVTLLAVHLFYLVGHFQFYISIYFLLIYFIYRYGSKKNIAEFKYVFGCLLWIAGSTLLYGVTEGFYAKFAFIREWIGLPHFILLSLTIYSLLLFNANNKKLLAQDQFNQ